MKKALVLGTVTMAAAMVMSTFAFADDYKIAVVPKMTNIGWFQRMEEGVNEYNEENGTDYVYRGRTDFHGLHGGELLKLSPKQQEMFGGKQEPGDLMPEYYVLKVNNFDKVALDSLDQWISFLKTGDIPEEFDAQGLPEARERLRVDNLPDKERREYVRELERRMVENDVMNTYYIDGRDEGLKEGKEEGLKEGELKGKKKREMEIARNMKGKNYPIEDIIDMTGLSAEEIAEL